MNTTLNYLILSRSLMSKIKTYGELHAEAPQQETQVSIEETKKPRKLLTTTTVFWGMPEGMK